MANITCETVKDLLPLYLDDVLSTDSRKLAEEHLESCPECREYFNRLKASDIASRQKKAANDKTVIKKIRKKIQGAPRRLQYWGWHGVYSIMPPSDSSPFHMKAAAYS